MKTPRCLSKLHVVWIMRNRFRIFQIESCTINAIYSLPVHVDERARNRRYIVKAFLVPSVQIRTTP